MVFFLTDGHPTVGVTDTMEILDNIKTANSNIRAPIFSLAFGRRTDFQMLRLLSVQMRRVVPSPEQKMLRRIQRL